MSFSEALGYPFRGENIPKVLTIILVFLIIIAAVFVGAMFFESAALIWMAIPIAIAFMLFLYGYMVAVIRSVADNESAIPQPEIGRDVGRGFIVLIAGLVHAIPFFVLYFCMAAIFGAAFSASINALDSSNGAGGSILMVCGLLIAMVVIGFIVGHTFIVGLVRYAIEDNSGALFDIVNNFSAVTSNLGIVFGLFIRSIGLAIIYAILGYVIQFVYLALVGNANSGVFLIAATIAYAIIYLSIVLMNQLSNAHLYAGLGKEMGIVNYGKSKRADNYDFSTQ